jgi:hypothetical protein
LQSYKSGLRKHLSLRKSETLYDEVILAVYLHAEERSGEALQIVTFLAHNFEYKGDHAQWKPVALGICLQTRLLTQAQRKELAQKAMQQLSGRPFLTDSADEIAAEIGSAPNKLAAAFADKSVKSSCRQMAKVMLNLIVYSEISRYDRAIAEKINRAKVEDLIAGASEKLRAALKN